MAGISLSGMASGLDTESIITQLMALEAKPKTLMQTQQKQLTGRKTAFEDVARQLRALSTAVADLKSTLTWGSTQKVTSSDDTRISARISGAAPAGNVTVNVTQLARSAQSTYAFTPSGTGTLTLTTSDIDGVDAPKTVGVDLTGVTTLQGAVDKINATTGVPVFAGIVNGKLVLTGKTAGESLTASLDGTPMTPASSVTAQNTEYTINGIPQDPTTKSVVTPGGLPGIELTLKNTGSATLTVTPPGADTDKVKEKLKAFVTAYNASIDVVRTKLSETPVKSPTTDAQFATGQLRNDFTLSKLQMDLRSAVGGADLTPGVLDTLAELGITVPKASADGKPSADALAGHLVIDDAKLTAALADPDAVKKMLGASGIDGVSQQLSNIIDPIAKASTGYLARSQSAADSQIKDYTERIADFDRRLSIRESRLRARFTALETALSQSQSQSSWVSSQLGTLPS